MSIVKQQLLAIRAQVDAALLMLDESESAIPLCLHPSEARADVTTMGASYRMFYCRTCGITVQTNEPVGT